MGKFDQFLAANISGQSKRLLYEWMEIDKLCLNNKRISYIARRKNAEGLPIEYEIIYRVRSIVGVSPPEKTEFMKDGKLVTKEVRKPVFTGTSTG